MRGWRLSVVLAVMLAVLANETPLDARGVPPPPDFSTTHTLRSWDGRGLEIPDLMDPTSEVLAEFKKHGGSRLVLKVDEDVLRKSLLTSVQDDVRTLLREARIGFVGLAIHDGSVEVRIRDGANISRAMTAFSELGGAVDVRVDASGTVRLKPTDAEYAGLLQVTMHEAIRMVTRRFVDFHLPLLIRGQQVGRDRIELFIAGLRDVSRFPQLMQASTQLTFRIIEGASVVYSSEYNRMAKTEVLDAVDSQMRYLVQARSILNGRDIRYAAAMLDPHTKRPMVAFRVSAQSMRRLMKDTSDLAGRSVAVALNSKAVATLKIHASVQYGLGRIDGSFTIDQARQLAVIMRAGILEVPWIPVEEEFIAPAKQ